MGTQSSHYCYCNKVITLNKDILLTSSTEPIIKLQANFRGFLYRKNHLSFTSTERKWSGDIFRWLTVPG